MHGARRVAGAGILASLLAALWSPSSNHTNPRSVIPKSATVVRNVLRTPPSIQEAQDLLIARCMRRRGYRYPAKTATRRNGDGYWIAPLDRLTVREASREGYGTAVGQPGRQLRLRMKRQKRYLSRLTAPARRDYFAALEGPPHVREIALDIAQGTFSVPLAGCVSHAKGRLFGDLRNYLLVTYLPQEMLLRQDAAWRDTDVRRALAAYDRCMAEMGYPRLSRPDLSRAAASRMFGDRGEDAPPTGRERALALADARCQTASGVVRAFARALARVNSGWLRIHERDIERILVIRQRALARARDVLDHRVRRMTPARRR
jgi:hypothetical protein